MASQLPLLETVQYFLFSDKNRYKHLTVNVKIDLEKSEVYN